MTTENAKQYTETEKVQYGSPDWDKLIERGWFTSTIDANGVATMAYVEK